MIEFMEEHEDIARGFTKGDRVVIDQLWKDLAEQLNSHGPPMKDSNGWKKVWSDWKCCIRKKLCHNRKEDRATGGGLFNKYTLSDMEDTVARLAGIYTVVGGVSNSSSIGCGEVIELPFSEEDHQSSSLRELEMPSMSEAENEMPSTSRVGHELASTSRQGQVAQNPRKRKRDSSLKDSVINYVQKESATLASIAKSIKMMEENSKKSMEVAKGNRNTNRKINKSLELSLDKTGTYETEVDKFKGVIARN